MNITVVGGGNIGTQFAVHFSEYGDRVTIFTSKPSKFSKCLSIVDENENIMHKGEIYLATDDGGLAFADADLIFVTVPAYLMNSMSEKMLPYMREGMKICLVPGTGGGECAFKKCIEKGCVLFGLQRVPSVARLVEYGKQVKCIGYRDELLVGAIPKKYTGECAEIISNVFSKKSYRFSKLFNFNFNTIKSDIAYYKIAYIIQRLHKR